MSQKIIYGKNIILHALENGFPKIETVLIQEKDASDKKQDNFKSSIINLCKKNNIKVSYQNKSKLDELTNHQTHQGVAAILIKPPEFLKSIDELFMARKHEEKSLILILDSIEDVRNVGALSRSALYFGFSAIIIPKNRFAKIDDAAFKTSCGALSIIPVVQVVNISRSMEELKKKGFWLYGTSLASGKNPYEVDFAKKSALVLGNENKGMRSNVEKHCDVLLKISRSGPMDSLNVSNAGAIFMYEMRKCLS